VGASAAAGARANATGAFNPLGSLTNVAEKFKGVVRAAVTANAKLHNGECPRSVPNVPGWDANYQFGGGCGLEKDICKCPMSPLYGCTTTGPRLEGVKGAGTDMFVSSFGYCRVAPWVIVVSVLLLLGLLGMVVILMCRRKKRNAAGEA